MIETLKLFASGKSLFEATSGLLAKLNIEFDRETAEPIDVADLYDNPMPAYLTEALQSIEHTYFIGIVNDQSLAGAKSDDSLGEIAETIQHGGKYDGMFVFACEAKKEANLTRTLSSALTRAFNKIASANPVILVIRQGNLLSLATCERMEYSQAWRQGNGEKIGKVSILRNVDCSNPHRGHVDILESLGDKAYPTFEQLYKHWMEVFSSELLTKKFYNELSDWYAWAVQIVKFPNDLRTTDDDAKFNHEACIRLITRLIFVWFLKQKHLIPEEFFDENYIRENLIENFNPHDKQNLLYNTEQSKYYRLILQNLFFAMLNCPIVAEGKTTPNNRRFRGDGQKGYVRDGYNVNNLMRYKSEFATNGGADKFMKLANRSVPFLNGGLFDCLDNKPHFYYDGFSERKESLEQLFFPDYLFFGDEVGNGIDLSKWYDDKKKKNVSARGIIDILKRYSFTIEENTPYDQEVSLDPELLGKVFENLLAAYNPETKQTARKQTGSFYTPREIVQYMVDESLVAHLKRMCGDDKEAQYRALLSYATGDVELSDEFRQSIMKAIYNCRVLDPACGSGAFPMGVLQQMVHVLKRIDPTNKMWNSMMVDIAIQDAKQELEKVVSGDAAEKAKIEENRQARLDDIESAFNRNINDPDYARKLYLIEHCIYGVDIQPIATQISKLRFFISLVVDQKPTKDAMTNFGIRPLPNLEAKFVTANTLIPLDRSRDLFTNADEIRYYEERLQEINHQIFIAKKNTVKRELQQLMYSTRMAMAQSMENLGAIGSKGYKQLMEWNPFDQNASASFFDPEWMFGVKGGFDVVIGNPPYVQIKKTPEKDYYKKLHYKTFDLNGDLYCLFYERGILNLKQNGILAFITSNKWMLSNYGEKLRLYFVNNANPIILINMGQGVFLNAAVDTNILLVTNDKYSNLTKVAKSYMNIDLSTLNFSKNKLSAGCTWNIEALQNSSLKNKVEKNLNRLNTLGYELDYGILTGANKAFILTEERKNELIALDQRNAEIIKPIYRGQDIERYYAHFSGLYLLCIHNGVKKTGIKPINVEKDYPTLVKYFERFGESFRNRGEQGDTVYNLRNCAYINKFETPKIIYADIVQNQGKFYLDTNKYYTNNTAFIITGSNLEYLLGILNSKAFNAFYKMFYCGGSLGNKGLRYKREFLLKVPIPICSEVVQTTVTTLVHQILLVKEKRSDAETTTLENQIDLIVYHLYNLTYDEVLIVDPSTPITREAYDNFKGISNYL